MMKHFDPRITQENGSWTRYHPRKQLLATVSPKKTGHQHLTKHFPPTYHPRYHLRKQLLATVSPKKTGHQHLTKHFPPTYHPRYHPRKQLLATVSLKKTGHWHLMKHFPTTYHPRKRVLYTVSPKKTNAGYSITQENRPPALDETFPNYVSPKKTGPGHGITQENNCWLLYRPRKQATST